MRRLLPRYPQSVWLLAIGMVIHSSGAAFVWPLNTIYVHEVLGRSVAMAGVVLMLQSGAGMIGSLIGGWCFDHWGGRVTVLTGACLAALSVSLLAFSHDWDVYVVLMVALGFSTSLIYPTMFAFSSAVWPEGGRRAFNVVYVAQNIGVAVGSSLGGFVAQVGFRYSFLGNATALLLFALLAYVGFRGPAWANAQIHRAASGPRVGRRFDARQKTLLMLALGMFLCWVPYVQWQTTTATYMQDAGFRLSQYSFLWTINGGVILLGQPLVTWLTNRLPRVKLQILVGNLLFVLAYALLLPSPVYGVYMLAMLFTTLGEMLVWPGVPAAADQLASPGQRGWYQGVISSAGTTGRMIGPLLGGILFDTVARPTLYLVMLCLFAAALLVLHNYDRWLGAASERVKKAEPYSA